MLCPADLLVWGCGCLAPRRHMRGEGPCAAAAGCGGRATGLRGATQECLVGCRRGCQDGGSMEPSQSQLQTYLSWLLPRSRAAAWCRPPRGAGCPPRPRPLECFLLSRHLLRAASFSLRSIGNCGVPENRLRVCCSATHSVWTPITPASDTRAPYAITLRCLNTDQGSCTSRTLLGALRWAGALGGKHRMSQIG